MNPAICILTLLPLLLLPLLLLLPRLLLPLLSLYSFSIFCDFFLIVVSVFLTEGEQRGDQILSIPRLDVFYLVKLLFWVPFYINTIFCGEKEYKQFLISRSKTWLSMFTIIFMKTIIMYTIFSIHGNAKLSGSLCHCLAV